MDKEQMDSLAQILRFQRNNFLNEFRRTEDDLELMAEDRESELEERAQEERSARLLARIDDRTLRAVEEIDAALQRLSEGTYGICESCSETITLGRLQTLPATRYCKACAERKENEPVPGAEETTPLKGRVSGDLSLLGGHELAEVIREHLREDGRVDTEELRIVCREGVVYLDGVLPSEAEHQILLQIVTDILGLEEVVDGIQVEELLWERQDRSKEEHPEELPPWQEPASSEDIVESSEEGTEFVAPSAPTPKEE
jgi:DnaK suppressor protein